jgi:nucleoside-diphosphate-sugar epimerase
MPDTAIVTGGAGFIGSPPKAPHVRADRVLREIGRHVARRRQAAPVAEREDLLVV